MKERQRWQPEEDALLRAYVKQYGPRDWDSVTERMGKALDRDAKSCVERWKNYLKPGIKKGPLSEEEQNLVIHLQEKYGNKWKKIAAEVPGRTAKRLGKWWEVYKEKEKKEKERGFRFGGAEVDATTNYSEILASFAEKFEQRQAGSSSSSLPAPPSFLVQPVSPLLGVACFSPNLNTTANSNTFPGSPHAKRDRSWLPNCLSVGAADSNAPELKEVDLRKETALRFLQASSTPSVDPHVQSRERAGESGIAVKASSLPPWMSKLPSNSRTLPAGSSGAPVNAPDLVRSSLFLSLSTSPTDTVVASKECATTTISESPESSQNKDLHSDGDDGILTTPVQTGSYQATTEPQVKRKSPNVFIDRRPMPGGSLSSRSLATVLGYCKELEEHRKAWSYQKKEATWKLRRLEQQLEAERIAKSRQKAEEVDACVRVLRAEERKYLDCLEAEYKEKVDELHRDAEVKESKLLQSWVEKHAQLTRLLEDLDS